VTTVPGSSPRPGDLRAERGHYYVAKDEVPYMLGNELIGREKPGLEHEGEKYRSP
jgi:hypothetical protein